MDLTPRSITIALLLAFALAALALAFTSGRLGTLKPLLPADAAGAPLLGESGWQPGAYPAVDWPESLRRLTGRGSWVDGDGFTGEHLSGWYQAAAHAAIMVSGYPRLAPNRLEIEVRTPDGRSTIFPFAGENPREGWVAWRLPLPAGEVTFRVRGIDATTGPRGWLAFSEPFTAPPHRTFDFRPTVQTLGTVALSLLLVLGPGLAWRARRRTDFIAVLWPGPAWLALGGCVCWAAGGFVPAAAMAVAWVGATLAVLAWLGRRDRPWQAWTPFEARVLALVALSVLGAAAKASFSGGPAGELYAGRISRTLEAGDRPDSRISYHTVQLVAHHLAPYEREAAKYFAPWDFSGRGPLAGLAAAPLVLATGGRPPLGMPDQPWSPFDREGFAAYRIAMITLAALSLVAVAGLLLLISGERSARLGISLVALTPFYWHELYYSWPKLASATFVLTAFHALLGRRVLVAALWLGAGYLCHPLALLSVPFLCLWLLLARPPSLWGRLARAATLGIGVLGVIVAWHAINGFQPSQGGFLQYPRAADGIYDASPAAWWLSRWQSFANTFLPFHGLTSRASQLGFDAGEMDSGGTVRFFFQYWTSAPFAAGLLTALAALPAFGRALWRQWRVAMVTLIGPALFLTLYWGVTTTGLMREGAHALFLGGWIFLAWAEGGALPPWAFGCAFSALRSTEVLAMMFLPAFAAGMWRSNWLLNDAWWLAITVLCVAGVAGIVANSQTRPAQQY